MRFEVRRGTLGLGGLVVALLVVALVFTSALAVLAFAAPVVGLFWLGRCVRGAVALWKSGGRLPMPGGVRVVEVSRTRGLALAQVGSGLAGLALASVPSLWLFVSGEAALWAGVGGFALRLVVAAVRRRMLAHLNPVDVLPPE